MVFSNAMLIYATSIGTLGEELTKASSIISKETPKNFEELREAREKLKNALDSYKMVEISLKSLSPPPFLKDDHNELCLVFSEFIDGTEQFHSSITINQNPTRDFAGIFNAELYQQGLNNQQYAVQKALPIVLRIAKKIEDSLKNSSGE